MVWGIGLLFQQAYRHREAQYQLKQAEQALMDAERERERVDVNRQVAEREWQEKRSQEQAEPDDAAGL